jgi:hypothetical protein
VRAVTPWRRRPPTPAPATPDPTPTTTLVPTPQQAGPDTPTFLLGTGAQKAGTSWLHDHLAGSPQCIAGYRKEYHVFDALDLPSEEWMRARIAMRARREGRRAVDGAPVDANGLHRAAMLYDPTFYVDYFLGLLSRDPAYRLVLDMTPDYAMLAAERLRWIRERFAERGVRTVAVFLVRDPVERIWSHVRMEKTRRPERFSEPAETYVRDLHAQESYALRTRYDRTLAALDEVFAPEDLHVGFYEQLFTTEQVAAVERLARIEPRRPDFDLRVNASPKAAPGLPDDTVRAVATHYREVYDAVAARFPEVDLAALWPSARLLG